VGRVLRASGRWDHLQCCASKDNYYRSVGCQARQEHSDWLKMQFIRFPGEDKLRRCRIDLNKTTSLILISGWSCDSKIHILLG
jgi:hypothetical protein